MKDKVIKNLVTVSLICFISGAVYAFSSSNIYMSKAIAFAITFFLLLISMVLWNFNKNQDVYSPNYKPSINKVTIFVCGFLLLLLEGDSPRDNISPLQNGILFILLFSSLIFELYRHRKFKLKYIDRFMFSFSICFFELFIYVFIFLFYNALFDEYGSSIRQKASVFLSLLPTVMSRFFIGLFLSVILSSILPLFFSSYNREESLILDEDETK